jgi:hypothetical protein
MPACIFLKGGSLSPVIGTTQTEKSHGKGSKYD